MAVIPWSPLGGGWLTGRYRKDQPVPQTHRATRVPQRYDMTDPGNKRKLEAVERLAGIAEEAGTTLVHLALAFVMQHPAVTAPIIGPRTMEQLETQLGATELQLNADLLDEIDAVVAPGETLATADNGWQPPALADATLRRR
jgi:aryl-alcohol dehydrogenase-like predicted oxidoreductase